MNEQLVNYIKENLAKGVAQDQIRQTLLTSGWQPADIDAAFLQLNSPQQLKTPQISIKEQKSFLNPKILIVAIAIILLLTAGGGSYLFFFKEKPATVENQQLTTHESKTNKPDGETTLTTNEIQLEDCVTALDTSLFPDNLSGYGTNIEKATLEQELEEGVKKGFMQGEYGKVGNHVTLFIVSKDGNKALYDFNDKKLDYLGPKEKTLKKELFGESVVFFWLPDESGRRLAQWNIYSHVKDKFIVALSGQYTEVYPDGEPTYIDWVKKVCS